MIQRARRMIKGGQALSLAALILLAACTAPSPEQLEALAALQATEAVAVQTVAAGRATEAAVRATEAAAAEQLARLTDQAIDTAQILTATLPAGTLLAVEVPASPTATATLETDITFTAPTEPAVTVPAAQAMATTLATAAAGLMLAPAEPITATETAATALAIAGTPTQPPTATPTATSSPTATPAATASPSPTSTTTPTVSPSTTATPTASPSPTATSTPVPPIPARVSSPQANIRNGPALEFPVIGTLPQGTAVNVLGSSKDQTWWQVCCVDDREGWINNTVLTLEGDPTTVPISSPLLPDDLQAAWAIHWECYAEGCPRPKCVGASEAEALQVRTERWLEVKREAIWEERCGEREEWLTQVDRYSGAEQQSQANPSLFVTWAGADPGPETKTIDLTPAQPGDPEITLSLWCTGMRTGEVEQGEGWTTLFEGEACYDRRSGVLATMQYVKRWLYSGTFGGQTYERQYFGDYEVYRQTLTDTNAPLSEE